MKKESVEPLEEDPSLALSIIPNGFLHLEDVKGYLKWNFEIVGDGSLIVEYNKIYKQDDLQRRIWTFRSNGHH